MTTLLSSTTATGAMATEGDVKTFLANLRTFMADFLGTDSANKAAVQVLLGASLNGKLAKSGAYTVVPADRGKVIDCTGTWTLNFSAAATLGDGFVFAVRNSGSGSITLDPNMSETINGQSSLVIGNGSFYLIYCDGVGFSTVGASQAKGAQVFTAPGTFTIPTGVTALKVTVVGGGGGGSGSYAGGAGSGGGGGGTAIKYLTGLTPGATLTVAGIGVGGAASSAGGSSSVTSGTQTIAAISATGGAGGNMDSGGGAGGVGSGGDVNLQGGGGGGGGVGGGMTTGGAGGSSSCGGGARGVMSATSLAGAAAGSYGGGGGGSANSGTGGVGAAGVVVFEW